MKKRILITILFLITFNCFAIPKYLKTSTTFEYFYEENNNGAILASFESIYDNYNIGLSVGISYPLGIMLNANGGYCFEQKMSKFDVIHKINCFVETVGIIVEIENGLKKDIYQSKIGLRYSSMFKLNSTAVYPVCIEPFIQCGISNSKRLYFGSGISIGILI